MLRYLSVFKKRFVLLRKAWWARKACPPYIYMAGTIADLSCHASMLFNGAATRIISRHAGVALSEVS
jgi:hypothetical protein